jgi:hypothetical protein
MKKKLEADLISIAHRVLKLKGKEDVIQLHQEAQKLYEKLAVLRFYEENINVLKDEISGEQLEEKLFTETPSQPEVVIAVEKVQEVETEVTSETAIEEAIQEVVAEETIEEEVLMDEEEQIVVEEKVEDEITAESEPVQEETKEEKEESVFSPLFELATEEEEKPVAKMEQKQISFEDLLGTDYKEPEFVKVNDVPQEVEKVTEISFEKVEETIIPEVKIETKTETFTVKTEHKTASLNDTLIKGINIGLNDRIAFVKHLFGGSNEDFNRVISQISTYDSFEEVQQFVVDMVKPDYNNWEGKEEYADRFMNLVEKKFA